MNLDVTEAWIIEKINLNEGSPGDVKSVSLCGSYLEKIASVGFSLQNFTGLQRLDLSKNNLTSLKGLEHLLLLEHLNLYYNKIKDLKELFRLRNNRNLKEVDLRLNPVTGTEPDYRLFILHMLPVLQILDDRPVHNNERKAALIHFSVHAGTDGGSSYNGEELDHLEKTEEIDKESSGLVILIEKCHNQATETQRNISNGEIVVLSEEQPYRPLSDNKESNSSHYVADFSPNHNTSCDTTNIPVLSTQLDSMPSSQVSLMSLEEYNDLPGRNERDFGESTTNQEVCRRKNLTQIKFVEAILDVVDRYWNGSKSLHYHQKFQDLIFKPLENYEKDLSAAREVQIKVLQDKLSAQQREIGELHRQLHEASKQVAVDPRKTKDLSGIKRELESTRSRLQLQTTDNKILRSKIVDLENQLMAYKTEAESLHKDQVSSLEQQKKDLERQVVDLTRNAEHYGKISDLAVMLQESHRSLLANNDHLISELEDTKCRHKNEIEQLKWSYDQLRVSRKLTQAYLMNGEV